MMKCFSSSRKCKSCIQNTVGQLLSSGSEQLQLIPEKLEARITEKRFLTAVEVLQDALRMIRKTEMENIGALGELRVYLTNQETSLTDILIEELHNHLYLKSPYCQDRWVSYAQSRANSANKGNNGAMATLSSGFRPIHRFLETLDVKEPMVEDASRNPEADGFYYIQLLVESLNKLGRLEVAVQMIDQRLPIELFKLVDKTNNEVDQRHPSSISINTRDLNKKVELGLGENDVRISIIIDLLGTLYSKFEAIAEGHRVLHDVVTGIVKREGIRRSNLTGGFKELWKLYQSEIRSLLHDYLATDGDLGYSSGPGKTRNLFLRTDRDKTKRLLRLQDMDKKSIEMTTEQEDLETILKASVPGLVSNSRAQDGAITSDNQHTDGSATGHKLLIEPSVFNMGLLLPPSLAFLHTLKEVVPPGSEVVVSTLTSFLDDFLVNVFHPQLDETLVDLSARTYAELDAFQEDPQWHLIARRPLFKGTSSFFNLITAFCKMLDTIPHDQSFSQLIIRQMTTYYHKCHEWYKSIVSRQQTADVVIKKRSAELAGTGEIRDLMSKIWASESDDQDLLKKETQLLLENSKSPPLLPSDIILDRKSIALLCLLYNSMRWLASKVTQLRKITDKDSRDANKARWSLVDSYRSKSAGDSQVFLPMSEEMAR
jgi:exocyst complex component 4